jgi:ABC-type Zn uptake system ZnuABC Zn-binding protein ZnuA
MKKISMIIVCTIAAVIFFASCDKPVPRKEAVLTGSTLIESLVRDAAPGLKTINLVPPLQCPGNFDMKPEDAKKAASAKVFLMHPYQGYLEEKIVKINSEIMSEILANPDMNTPGGYITGLADIRKILIRYYPERKKEIEDNTGAAAKIIRKRMAADDFLIRKIKAKKIKVISSLHQGAFPDYMGFEVVARFGSPDSTKPEEIRQIVEKAKKEKVKYIISNITGDTDTTADIINKELNVKKIVLSCFPPEEGQGSWMLGLLDYNMNVIRSKLGIK